MTDPVDGAQAPLLSVRRGAPTPDELAALLVALASRPAGPASGPQPGRSTWSARSRMMRGTVRPGRGAWRASALPG